MNTTGQSKFDQARIEWALRLNFSPMPRLSSELLIDQLNQFRIGVHWLIGRSWEVMVERDPILGTNFDKRCKELSSLDWEIESDGSAEGDDHAASLQFAYDHCLVTRALEQDYSGGVESLLRHMGQAHGSKYSIHEMLVDVRNPKARECTFEFRHTPMWLFESRRGYLGYLPHVFDLYGQPLASGEWLPAIGDGYLRAATMSYCLKWFGLRDWALASMRGGIPWMQLITDAAPGTEEWRKAEEILATLAGDGAVVTQRNIDLKVIELLKSGELPFPELVEYADRTYASLFRGADLATGSRQSQTGDGKSTGASVQGDEMGIHLRSDATWATAILNRRADAPLIQYLYGTEPKAWIKIVPPRDDDTAGDIAAAQFMVNNRVEIAKSTIRERLNYPAPKAGEETIGGEPPPSPGDPAAAGGAAAPRSPNDESDMGSDSRRAAPSALLISPGARPGPNQLPDLRMPGAGQPVPPGPFGQEKALSNAAGDEAGPSKKFTANAAGDLAHALQADIGDILDELNALKDIDDPDHLAARSQALLAKIEKRQAAIAKSNAAADAIAQIKASAFVNGIAAAAKAQTKTT